MSGATPSILVVDDDADLRTLITDFLRANGMRVEKAADGAEMDARIATERPDLVVLDLMMPGEDGLSILRRLRKPGGPAVIMLSAMGEDTDRIIGLEVGADDYLPKPCNPRELLARIRAVLRRSDAEGAPEDVVTFGRLKVDRTAHRVYVDGAEVVLTALEFRLLSTLIDRRNRVQSRDALLADVWGLQMHVETRTVDTHIKRLREKLGAAGEYIHTVRGVGYRFASDPGDPGG